MLIDLSDPFFISLSVAIISLGVAGIIKFAVISHEKKLIEDSFFRLRTEFESAQKEYKKQIEDINKKYSNTVTHLTETNKEEKIKAIEKALDIYDKKFTKLLAHNQPPPKSGNVLRDIYLRRKQI
jgi:hypothetical protein